MPSPRPAHPRFPVGARVRIRDMNPPVHHRVPAYAKGRVGTVERVCMGFQEPELAAIYREGPDRPIYRVRLHQPDLWPAYAENPADTLEIEIFEHWLEEA
ncbi:SH3-like domain-containing protein [Futiania mangrovi]|uniref:Nitrile hydratase subunit beta n=1 Tax=Futiania mangrovi TaxID=2959716 RepID=A0A9J6PL61_9PROT|nr:SH3-like domain-containing protein [Futiania mangrovii]MCP1337351.1 nitrile hydratase subunit beta [Futiania mangrovii]